MHVTQVHDAVGRRRPAAQAVEILEVPAQNLGTGIGQSGGGGIGAGETHHRVSGTEQFGNDGGTDEAGPAGNEEMHDKPPARRHFRTRLPGPGSERCHSLTSLYH